MNNNEQNRIDELEKRIKDLEEKVNRQMPWNKPYTPLSPNWPDDWKKKFPKKEEGNEYSTCPTCGLKFEYGKAIFYVCSNYPCAMGLGGTMI